MFHTFVFQIVLTSTNKKKENQANTNRENQANTNRENLFDTNTTIIKCPMNPAIGLTIYFKKNGKFYYIHLIFIYYILNIEIFTLNLFVFL